MLYRQLKVGQGNRPDASSCCQCRCSGTLLNGTVIFNGASNSSDGATCTLIPRDLVKVFCNALRLAAAIIRLFQGLSDALLAMQEGDKWEVVVPPHLGYEGRKHGTAIHLLLLQ